MLIERNSFIFASIYVNYLIEIKDNMYIENWIILLKSVSLNQFNSALQQDLFTVKGAFLCKKLLRLFVLYKHENFITQSNL